jgi:hypothetical protein
VILPIFLALSFWHSHAYSHIQPQPQPGYMVEIETSSLFGKTVVVCSVLSPGMVVGGGDNCDFHHFPDPVYCSFFPRHKGCGKHPENLPNECGTSFGCQNLDAFKKPVR